MGIAEFITARLDEDEATARAAFRSKLRADGVHVLSVGVQVRPGGQPVAVLPVADAIDAETAAFIARHDPAWVLRDVAAKRAILARYQEVLAECATMLRANRPRVFGEHDGLRKAVEELAAIDSGHPDYQPEWAPTEGSLSAEA